MDQGEGVLVAHEAVDGEARLVTHAEATVGEHVKALRLCRQENLPKACVPRLEAGDLVYYHLGGYEVGMRGVGAPVSSLRHTGSGSGPRWESASLSPWQIRYSPSYPQP